MRMLWELVQGYIKMDYRYVDLSVALAVRMAIDSAELRRSGRHYVLCTDLARQDWSGQEETIPLGDGRGSRGYRRGRYHQKRDGEERCEYVEVEYEEQDERREEIEILRPAVDGSGTATVGVPCEVKGELSCCFRLALKSH